MMSSTQIYVSIVFAVQRSRRLVRPHQPDQVQILWAPTRFRSYGAAGNFLRCIYVKDFAPTELTPSHETPGSHKTSRRFHG